MNPSKMNEAKRLKLETSTRPTLTPILADELYKEVPLIEVYVGKIKDPKTISKVVVDLNSVLPIAELTHLKRVRGGKEILLFPKETTEESQVLTVLEEKGFDTTLIEEEVRAVSVAEIPPKVRKQYEVVHKLWPCNFHSNPHLEKLSTNTLFSETELEQHAKFMKAAIDIREISGVECGTVVVDPGAQSIVGFGFSQTDHPTKHAVMVAIDDVAKTQKGGVWAPHGDREKIETFLGMKYRDLKFGFGSSQEGPYLCTGYSVYTTREPCITCAMALVHSRAKRVFYGVKSEKGALGTLCKIHTVENLNHHYEVFAGLLEVECGAK